MNTHLTDPDCPHSVRDQINGGVTQEAHAVAAEKPRYWKHQRKHGFQYAVSQLHFQSKEAGFRWVAEYRSDETEAAKAGWADDAPFFTSNIWADVPALSEREQLEARVAITPDEFRGMIRTIADELPTLDFIATKTTTKNAKRSAETVRSMLQALVSRMERAALQEQRP